MAEPRLFVLGNASIDQRMRVAQLPRRGETLMARAVSLAPGGKGLNQAVAAARCGVAVHFCAPLGHEPETAMIREALAALAAVALPQGSAATDRSILLVGDDAENCIVSTGDCADGLAMADAMAFLDGLLPDDVLLVQGNLSAEVTLAAVRRSSRAIFNAAPIRWPTADVAAHCAMVIANAGEAETMTGLADPAAAAHALGGRIGIVTLGAGGCLVAQDGGLAHHPAVAAAAVDTTGAGDVFCGVLAAGILRGLALADCIAAGQAAAALAVSRAGCHEAIPSRDEMAALHLVPNSRSPASPNPGRI